MRWAKYAITVAILRFLYTHARDGADDFEFAVNEEALNSSVLARSLQAAGTATCSIAMMMAARYGDEVQMAVSLGIDKELPSCVDDLKRTPLHLAAEANQRNVSLQLLAAGALMDRDVRGRAPLHNAAIAGHVDLTSLLLDMGAYIELRDNGQRTPLHLAAFKGHTAMVELLLDRLAEIDALDGDSRIPLHYTCRSDNFINATQLLIARGADIEREDRLGFRAMHVACYEHQMITSEYLLDLGADLYALDIQGWNPLVHAAAGEPYQLYDALVTRLIYQTLKPQVFPTADPAMELHVKQDPNTDVFLGFNGVMVALIITGSCGGCIVCTMFYSFRRFANLRKPYFVTSNDKIIEDFIDEVFEDLMNAPERVQKQTEEWDKIPAHTLKDLHRVKQA